jgi:flagellar hook-associated protein 1
MASMGEPMGTLTSLMDMSRQALMADQTALNVTANNVSNQNTPGYTREVVNWQPVDAVTINGSKFYITENSGQSAISQRDRVLEQRVQQQTQVQGQSSALESAMQEIQNIFGLSSTSESASSTALGSAMDSYFGALSKLSASPSDASVRQSVLTAANTLASTFNSSAQQLAQISSSLDQQVGTVVGQVNTLTATIASLNKQIASISPNQDAGTLEDQRQQAITQLSQYVGLNQTTTENNGITLTTSNGALLVSGDQSYAMSTAQVSGTTHVLAGIAGQDVTSGLTGGTLGGVLQARDQELPVVVTALDNLAYGIGTQTNLQNEQGLDGNGNAGQALFSLSATANGAAASIQVATTDPNAVAAAAVGEGSAGNGNALALADLSTANVVGGQTASGYYAALLGQIGTATASASTDNTVQQATLTQLTTQRDSLSGVSLDEEAANLTQYQRSYQAAAKLLTIADSIMSSAINLGDQVAVS